MIDKKKLRKSLLILLLIAIIIMLNTLFPSNVYADNENKEEETSTSQSLFQSQDFDEVTKARIK